MTFAWISFARQGAKGEDIPSYSFFPLLLWSYPKDLVPLKGTGAEGSLAGWRTRSAHRGSSLFVDHEEDWLKWELSWLHLDKGLHALIFLNLKDWTVFYPLWLRIRIISELKWIFHYATCC